MCGSLPFLPPSNFAVFHGWYFLQYCLQKAENCTNFSTQSALSTFAFSSYIYGHGFYEVSRMLLIKNVNNDVSKDWPIEVSYTKVWQICYYRSHRNTVVLLRWWGFLWRTPPSLIATRYECEVSAPFWTITGSQVLLDGSKIHMQSSEKSS